MSVFKRWNGSAWETIGPQISSARFDDTNHMIAPEYSSTSIYNVGDYVVQSDKLYKCISAIESAEEWTAAHWTQVSMGGEVSDLNSAFSAVYIVSSWEDGVYVYTNSGLTRANENYASSPFIEASKVDAIYSYYSSASGVCFYDDRFQYISGQTPATNGIKTTLVLDKPTGTAYIRFSTNKTKVATSNVRCWALKSNFLDSMGLKTDQGISQNALTSLLCSEVTGISFSPNHYIKSTDGEAGVSSLSYATLDFIPIDKITHIYTMLSGSACIAYYSEASESAFVGIETRESYGLRLYALTKPLSAKYLRISALKPTQIGISDASYVRIFRFYPDIFKKDIDNVKDKIVTLEESIGISPDMSQFTFSNIAYNATLGWVNRAYIITTDQVYYTTDDAIVKANDGYLAMVSITDSTGEMVLDYFDFTSGKIQVKKGQYIRISYRNNPSGSTAISPSIGSQCGGIILMTLNDKVEQLMEFGTGNADNLIMSADEIAAPNDFFIKSTDTSGRILEVLNPYANKKSKQLMGQLHCHSWASGENFESTHIKATAEAVYDIYNRMGYDFLTITNYPYGNDITPNPKLTGNMIWLCNSYEMPVMPLQITADYQYTHLICLNVPGVYYPGQYTGNLNDVIDALDAEGETLVLAHPGWYWTETAQTLYTAQQLLNLSNKIKYVEVCNTFADCRIESPYISNPAYALDILASAGRKIFGTAVSDSHVWEDSGITQITGGNIKVFANRKTRSDIWEAIKTGNYYCCSSYNAFINSVDLSNNVLTINTDDSSASTKFIGKNASVLATVSGENPSYQIDGSELYVRAEVTLSNGAKIWTNPIYILASE